MKAKNLNASSVKTRNLIRDTFAELLYEKKNINKITVTELVQRADINRSTFYSHYDDVRHVAEDIKAETLKAFFENKTISNVHDIEPFFDEIYAYIKKNDSFFRLIFISDEVTNFVRHLGNICKGRIYEAVNKDDSIRDKHLLELEVSAFSDGIAMQFIRYYHNDYNVTLEEIIECGKLWCRTMIERRSENRAGRISARILAVPAHERITDNRTANHIRFRMFVTSRGSLQPYRTYCHGT